MAKAPALNVDNTQLKMKIVERRVMYIRLANKERVKESEGKEFDPKLIKAARKFLDKYPRPVFSVKADATTVVKAEEVLKPTNITLV